MSLTNHRASRLVSIPVDPSVFPWKTEAGRMERLPVLRDMAGCDLTCSFGSLVVKGHQCAVTNAMDLPAAILLKSR